MHIHLTSSPNWSSSHALDANQEGIVAFAGHQSVTVLCSRKHHILQCLGPHKGRVSSVAFVPYGRSARLVAGCADGTARCWDWQAGGCLAAAKARSKAELTAVVLPAWAQEVAVFGDASGQLLQWTFSSNAKLALLTKLGSKVCCLAAAPAAPPGQQQLQQVLAGCADGSCVLVDSSSGSQLLKWSAHTAAVQSVLWMAPPTSSKSGNSSSGRAQQVLQPQDAGNAVATEGQQMHTNGLEAAVNSSGNGLVGSSGSVIADSTSRDGCGMAATAAASCWRPSSRGSGRSYDQFSSCRCSKPSSSSGRQGQRCCTAGPARGAAGCSSGSAAADGRQWQLAAGQAQQRAPRGCGAGARQRGGGRRMHAADGWGGRRRDAGGAGSRQHGLPHSNAQASTQPHHLPTRSAASSDVLRRPAAAACHAAAGLYAAAAAGAAGVSWQLPRAVHLDGQNAGRVGACHSSERNASSCSSRGRSAAAAAATAAGAEHAAAPAAAGAAVPCPAAAPPDAAAAGGGAGAAAQPAAKAGSKKKGGKGGAAAAAAGEALLPSLAPAGAAAAAAGYRATGCKVQWSCQGLGGYAYAVAAQRPSPDMSCHPPQYSPVRVAVGCGDKTIRVLTLGVRQQLAETSGSSSSSSSSSSSAEDGGAVRPGSSSCITGSTSCGSLQAEERSRCMAAGDGFEAAAQGAAAAAPGASSSSSSSSSSSGCAAAGAQWGAPAACGEVQRGVRQAQLLWRNIQDKVLAWPGTQPTPGCSPTAARTARLGCMTWRATSPASTTGATAARSLTLHGSSSGAVSNISSSSTPHLLELAAVQRVGGELATPLSSRAAGSAAAAGRCSAAGQQRPAFP
ncbi:hypothetical protein COO60DRAFT_1067741 [Scenedesmus sp. NREL 46B-D3]|nr:hypothetical protein COO60DRAFT_1067741 [Scenedesmus sp. NREL 46B-D3]